MKKLPFYSVSSIFSRQRLASDSRRCQNYDEIFPTAAAWVSKYSTEKIRTWTAVNIRNVERIEGRERARSCVCAERARATALPRDAFRVQRAALVGLQFTWQLRVGASSSAFQHSLVLSNHYRCLAAT